MGLFSQKRGAFRVVGLLLLLGLIASLLLGTGRGGREREAGAAPSSVSRRGPAETSGGGAMRPSQTARELLLEERQAAEDLIGRMRGPAQNLPFARMARVGEAFPQALLDELAGMSAGQFQIVVLGIGKDPTIHGTTRTKLVIEMVDAWMAAQEKPGTQQLKLVLGVIEELLPELPPGHDVLPVNCVIRIGVGWDPEAMVGFIVRHWDRWGGPDSRNGEILRQSLLEHATDRDVVLKLLEATD